MLLKNRLRHETLNSPKLIENKFSGAWGGSRRVRIKKLCKAGASKQYPSVNTRAMIDFRVQMLYPCPAYFWCKNAHGAKTITVRGTFSLSHFRCPAKRQFCISKAILHFPTSFWARRGHLSANVHDFQNFDLSHGNLEGVQTFLVLWIELSFCMRLVITSN